MKVLLSSNRFLKASGNPLREMQVYGSEEDRNRVFVNFLNGLKIFKLFKNI